MRKRVNDIGKKIDYKVPDEYFENLPMRIQKRIEEESTAKTLIRLPNWSLAMAASIMLIIVSVFIFNGSDKTAEQLLADISEEDLLAYLDELDLDSYDLASAFPETANELNFEDHQMLDAVEFGSESIDEILQEYNLQEEDLDI